MIRAVALTTLLGVASAFMKAAPRSTRSVVSMSGDDRSIALPFDKRPQNLDGSLPGDYGFDPAGLSLNPSNGLIGGEEPNLKWYREAEIVHGRVAQLAVLGNLVPGWLGTFPGNPEFGVASDAFSKLNPYEAFASVPSQGLWQIFFAIFFVECFRIQRVINGDKAPGDLGLGQTGFNPFGFKYTPEEYFLKQEQEARHGRLAMIGILGILFQAKASGLGVTEQLASAFALPDERSVLSGFGTLNDYFPPNI